MIKYTIKEKEFIYKSDDYTRTKYYVYRNFLGINIPYKKDDSYGGYAVLLLLSTLPSLGLSCGCFFDSSFTFFEYYIPIALTIIIYFILFTKDKFYNKSDAEDYIKTQIKKRQLKNKLNIVSEISFDEKGEKISFTKNI